MTGVSTDPISTNPNANRLDKGSMTTETITTRNPAGKPPKYDGDALILAECVLDAGAWLASSEFSYWGCTSSGFSIATNQVKKSEDSFLYVPNGTLTLRWWETDGCFANDPISTMSYKERREFERNLASLTEDILRLAQERGLSLENIQVASPVPKLRGTYLGD
jgi:hypothetical protein